MFHHSTQALYIWGMEHLSYFFYLCYIIRSKPYLNHLIQVSPLFCLCLLRLHMFFDILSLFTSCVWTLFIPWLFWITCLRREFGEGCSIYVSDTVLSTFHYRGGIYLLMWMWAKITEFQISNIQLQCFLLILVLCWATWNSMFCIVIGVTGSCRRTF